MTQPNFIQVQTSLERACAFVEAHPDLSSSVRYGNRLGSMRDRFSDSTRGTDEQYQAWRNRLADELNRYRDIKVEYDRVVELADEHGYDDIPTARIVYTDTGQLFPLVELTVAWLNSHDGEWDWIAEASATLSRLVSESKERSAAAERLYQQYTVAVRNRVTAYDDAVSLMREYFTDAKRDAGRFEAFDGVELDVL